MENSLVSMAQQFSGLPMDSLIGGPLNAAAKANGAMALTQTKFMLDTCFHKEGESGSEKYSPIMIDMSLTRPVINADTGEAVEGGATTSFKLPLLTIIPLNSLGVDHVGIDFEMEVKSSFSDEQQSSSSKAVSAESSFEAKCGWGPFSVTVKGSASYDSKESTSRNTHYEKSNSAKYTVNVTANQLPLPKGVTTIIEAFAKTIDPIMIHNESSQGGGGTTH